MEAITIETGLQIEALQVKKAALVLRAVNHPLRQQMMRLYIKTNRCQLLPFTLSFA